jgi:hypothetical protein
MDAVLASIFALVPPGMLITIALASLAVFLATLFAIPFILVRLPANYFDVRVPRVWMKDSHPVLRLAGISLKNLAGVLFLLAGTAMLVLPGQGLLTMLIGISLLDFPGKQHVEARIVGQSTVLKVINTLRRKFGRPPLIIVKEGDKGSDPSSPLP